MLFPGAAEAYDFSAVSPSGHTLYYNLSNGVAVVTSQNNDMSHPAYDTLVGDVVIADSVVCNGETYVVSAIDEKAFKKCDSIITITIPASITSIGNDAFIYCNGLVNTYYLGTLAGWCQMQFGNQNSNPVSLSHNLSIGGEDIAHLVIPDSVTSIANYAFYGCTALTSITLHNSLTSMGISVFSGCTGLIGVTIPNGITTIPDEAFFNCTGLTSITLPNSVTSIGNSAFSNCSSLTSITFPSGLTTTGPAAFANCTSLTDITFPDSLKTISQWCFMYCTGLHSIRVPDGTTTIEEGAFCGCADIDTITIPNSLTFFGGAAFLECVQFNVVRYLGSLAEWCQIQFQDMRANPIWCADHLYIGDEEVIDMVIPDGVTVIGKYAFANFKRITSVTIPSTAVEIRMGAFDGCSGITSVSLPNSVASIGVESFLNCSGLTSITLPASVTNISASAFRGCTGLTSITIPNHVGYIGAEAFAECTALATVEFNADSCFYAGYGSKEIFRGCNNLTAIVFGNNVKNIPDDICRKCTSLITVVFGRSVTRIGSNAFRGCTGLQYIYSMAHVPPAIQIGAFYYVNDQYNDDIVVLVPCSAVIDYQQATVWNNYSNIQGSQYSFSATSSNIEYGSVDIMQHPTCSDMQAYVQANANEGYHFVRWSDGSTANPRYVDVDWDTVIVALFAEGDVGIGDMMDDGVNVVSVDGHIVVEGAESNTVTLFDIMGRQLAVRHNEGSPIRFDIPANGIYLVKVGPYAAHRVVVVR